MTLSEFLASKKKKQETVNNLFFNDDVLSSTEVEACPVEFTKEEHQQMLKKFRELGNPVEVQAQPVKSTKKPATKRKYTYQDFLADGMYWGIYVNDEDGTETLGNGFTWRDEEA